MNRCAKYLLQEKETANVAEIWCKTNDDCPCNRAIRALFYSPPSLAVNVTHSRHRDQHEVLRMSPEHLHGPLRFAHQVLDTRMIASTPSSRCHTRRSDSLSQVRERIPESERDGMNLTPRFAIRSLQLKAATRTF